MGHQIAVAFCLLLVIEGLSPFLSPAGWRAMMAAALRMSDASLRLAGLASMLLGTFLLYLVN